MTGRGGGGGGEGLQVSFLKRLFQIHLEMKGWLGNWVRYIIRHVDLQTHREKEILVKIRHASNVASGSVPLSYSYSRKKAQPLSILRFYLSGHNKSTF